MAGNDERNRSPKAMRFSGFLETIRPQNDNLCAFDDTLQACHNFFVKKPKIFENVKSERAAANFKKSRTPRESTIIFKNSQI